MRLACAAAADAKTRNQVLIFPSAGRSQDKGANCRAIMVGLDSLGAIVLRERVSRGRITSRLANLPPCLIGIEAGMATHYVARELAAREAGSAGLCEAVSAGTQE
jgi:hypothetical protein